MFLSVWYLHASNSLCQSELQSNVLQELLFLIFPLFDIELLKLFACRFIELKHVKSFPLSFSEALGNGQRKHHM
jgi:hypothetical protein